MKEIIVAIDGYSSTGKSTLARALAKKLSYCYIDTGAMYRALSLFAIEKGVFQKEPWDKEKFIKLLPEALIQVKMHESEESFILLNGKELGEEIRTMNVSKRVSLVASLPEARSKLLKIQQLLGLKKAVVMDGRDVGSVIFPKAELKIFLTSPLEIRSKRRYKEILSKGGSTSYKEVLENLSKRDQMDTTRELAPLIKPADAIEINNAYLSLEETLLKVYQLALERTN